ncbi:unnamed protein product [Coffea canephora]|uniref:Uncharacterized protein n=1 Tax=Coffea canephora TaxID=49390 RepID=A0A068VF62_COFCA|nr:unnamed protein product [Coffea canephora]
MWFNIIRVVYSQIAAPTTGQPIAPPPPPRLPLKRPRSISPPPRLPFMGPFKDRLNYFYNEGKDEYVKSRVQKYQSTVSKTNMLPGPFISSNPNVIVLLDGKSFPVLFDVSKVEKKDLFTGSFMPSTELTGSYHILSYLDPKVFLLLTLKSGKLIASFTFDAGTTSSRSSRRATPSYLTALSRNCHQWQSQSQ